MISNGNAEALEELIAQASDTRAHWSMNKNRR